MRDMISRMPCALLEAVPASPTGMEVSDAREGLDMHSAAVAVQIFLSNWHPGHEFFLLLPASVLLSAISIGVTKHPPFNSQRVELHAAVCISA